MFLKLKFTPNNAGNLTLDVSLILKKKHVSFSMYRVGLRNLLYIFFKYLPLQMFESFDKIVT